MIGISSISGTSATGYDLNGQSSFSQIYKTYYDNLNKPDFSSQPKTQSPEQTDTKSISSESNSSSTTKLSSKDQQLVDELKKTDTKVRQHEQAHLSAAGNLAVSGAHYDYETGPDGKKYAVGGDVTIDIAPVDDNPQATIDKMQQVRSAALAPSDPSSQDRAVANRASAEEAKARAELVKQTASGSGTKKSSKTDNASVQSPFNKAYGTKQEIETGQYLNLIQ